MQSNQVAQVQLRTLDKLTEHFERVMMPDDEFVQIVHVVISAGTSLLQEMGIPENQIKILEKKLIQHAKDKWLALCAKNMEPEMDAQTELAAVATDFDSMYENWKRARL